MSKEHRFSIGRSRDNDLVYDHHSVSRRHAELCFTAERRLLLIDCRSTNGTFVIQDGKAQKITQELISPTDTVQFGEVEVSVKELVESIRLKFPVIGGDFVDPNGGEKPRTEWPQGKNLVRCGYCGWPKNSNQPCGKCKRS